MERSVFTPFPRGGEGWGEGARHLRIPAPYTLTLHPPSRKGVVSGKCQLAADDFENAFGVFENLVVPETDHAIAKTFDARRAGRIDLRRMLTAVELEDEPCGAAGEVGDMPTNQALTDELRTIELTGAQMKPEASLSVGTLTAQVARGSCQSLRQRRSPAPQPSPLRGEEVFVRHSSSSLRGSFAVNA